MRFSSPGPHPGLEFSSPQWQANMPCPACRNCSPIGEGSNRACPSIRDEGFPLLHHTKERRRVTTNLRPPTFESGAAQALIQDVITQAHPNIFGSLSRVGHTSTRSSFSGCTSPRVFTKIAEAALTTLREVALGYLDDWLILAHSQDLLCAHRIRVGAQTP